MTRTTIQKRAEKMARFALINNQGQYHLAIAMLARRCKASAPHTLARILLIGASQLDTEWQERQAARRAS